MIVTNLLEKPDNNLLQVVRAQLVDSLLSYLIQLVRFLWWHNSFWIYQSMQITSRIQAGQYKESLELLEELRKIEEEQMGARTEKMAEIYQLMSKTKSEVLLELF